MGGLGYCGGGGGGGGENGGGEGGGPVVGEGGVVAAVQGLTVVQQHSRQQVGLGAGPQVDGGGEGYPVAKPVGGLPRVTVAVQVEN